VTPDVIDIEFATFKQHFLSRAQRSRLGLDIGQADARVIYDDGAALRREFITWQNRSDQPRVTTSLTRGQAPSGPWHRWMRVRRDNS
jgi:hypothetical protein